LSPDPLTYNPNFKAVISSLWGFPFDKDEKNYVWNENLPGPGQYEEKSRLGNAPWTVMTSWKMADYSNIVPGPGAHDISYWLIEKHDGSAIIKPAKLYE